MTEPMVIEGGEPVPEDPPWDAWHPAQIVDRLAGVSAPWCVAAGWALDLFRGGQTREHEDLEIAVPAGHFAEVRRALSRWEFFVVGDGRRWPVDSPAYELLHQTWLWDRAPGVYRLDVFREPHDGDTWICRRDETIRLPYDRIIRRTADGIPYLTPEIVLLFKAKHHRDKDQRDFEGVLPLLDAGQREWLAETLDRVHPNHKWLGDLERAGG